MRRPRKNYHFLSEINITPLTDVMLVLLIVFMATSSFIVTGQALNLNLPSATGEQIENSEKSLALELVRDGTVYLDGRKITIVDLKDNLASIKKSGASPPPVILRADRTCKYESFISILELLSEEGFDRLSLAVEPEEKQ